MNFREKLMKFLAFFLLNYIFYNKNIALILIP